MKHKSFYVLLLLGILLLSSMIVYLIFHHAIQRESEEELRNPDLIISAYNSSTGNLIDMPTTYFITIDLDWRPYISVFSKMKNLSIGCWTSRDVPFIINVFWEVKGFGKIILSADNSGQGFRKTDKTVAVNLNFELAKTKVRKLLERYESCLEDGYTFSQEVEDAIRDVERLLKQAYEAEDPVKRARYSDLALNVSLWAGEKLELEKAKVDIIKYRMTNLTLQVLDENGLPIW